MGNSLKNMCKRSILTENTFQSQFESLTPSFQYNLLQKLILNKSNSNIVISPLSIYLILSFAANGAVDETKNEIINSILGANYDINVVNEFNKFIMKTYQDVSIANGIFTKVKPTENFINVCNEYEVKADSLVSVNQVNEWVSEKTKGKIPSIISSIDNIKMILINAIYYHGMWKTQFKKSNTKKEIFYLSNGEEKKVDMMKITAKFEYYENVECQFIQLDYSKDNMCSYVILPKENIKIDDFINKNLTHENFKSMRDNLSNKKISLWLPRVTNEYSTNLKSILNELGMQKCFRDDANFSNITDEIALKIEDVIHKTYLKINEEGTEAAAVTAVRMSKTSKIHKEEIIEMKVNRPFIFIITSKDRLVMNGGFLFLSKIENC